MVGMLLSCCRCRSSNLAHKRAVSIHPCALLPCASMCLSGSQHTQHIQANTRHLHPHTPAPPNLPPSPVLRLPPGIPQTPPDTQQQQESSPCLPGQQTQHHAPLCLRVCLCLREGVCMWARGGRGDGNSTQHGTAHDESVGGMRS